MNDAAEKLLSGRAWHEFCDELKEVGDLILGNDFPQDSRERTEGYRYLTRLLAYAMRMEIECGDPLYPQLCRYEEPHNGWGGPNPDNTYLRAAIDSKLAYRVWGNLAGTRQIIISLHEGDMQLELYGVYSEQSLDDWEVGDDGRFELIVSKEKPASGNWMPMHEKARIFQVRIYQSDWENDASPSLHIERLGAEGVPPPPPEPAALANALARTSSWVHQSAVFWNQYTRQAMKHAVPNHAGPPKSPTGGAENIKYGSCVWELEDHQALVLTCEAPEAQYIGFCNHTPAWLESGDFANRQVSLSGDQLHIDDDGKIRIVISARDPGVPNWIDNEGRPRGLFVYRFVWAKTAPEPTSKVLAIDAVRDSMPTGHPVIDEAERRRRMRARREQLFNRYN